MTGRPIFFDPSGKPQKPAFERIREEVPEVKVQSVLTYREPCLEGRGGCTRSERNFPDCIKECPEYKRSLERI